MAVQDGCKGSVTNKFILDGLTTTWPLCISFREGLVLARPFVGVFKSQFTTYLSIFDNNFPQNGSKYGSMAPNTGLGYPHEGPSVKDVWESPCNGASC